MDKAALRVRLRARRRAFAANDRGALSEAVAGHALPQIVPGKVVAGYIAIGGEVDPLPLMRAALARGCTTALPHVDGNGGPMRFLHWQPGDPLTSGPHGLSQPPATEPEVRPHLILTPLVGFDRGMARLGQGAGYYDRAFATLPEARRIGLAWSVQEERCLPVDPWDIPLHGVATEREWIDRR